MFINIMLCLILFGIFSILGWLSKINERLTRLEQKESLTRVDIVDAIQSKPVSRWDLPPNGSFATNEQYAEMFPWPPASRK
jgi:hypothetical protein